MNKSTVFIQLRITYLFLLSLLLSPSNLKPVLPFISLSSSAPVYLTVYSSLLVHRRASLTVYHTSPQLELRGGHVSVFTLVYSVYFEAASNCGVLDTVWIISSGKTHKGQPGRFPLIEMTNKLNVRSDQCEVKQCIMNLETCRFLHYFLSALKQNCICFAERNKTFLLL